MKMLIATAFLVCSLPALAADPPLPPPEGRFCDEHPAKCEEMRARHDQFCKKNPQTCETAKKERDARRKYCKQHPEECEQLQEERAARRKEMHERCEANPVDCDEARQERIERRQRRSTDFCKKNPEKCDGKPEAPARSGPPR